MGNEVIIIPSYNRFDEKLPYGIESWRSYANVNGIGLEVPNHNIENKLGCNEWESGAWAKWDAVRSVIDDYDRFMLVDSDTIVRWDLPNIFELTKDFDFIAIDDINPNSGRHHYPQWGGLIDLDSINITNYFNTGIIIFTKEVARVLLDEIDAFFDFYSKRVENGVKIDAVEQTAVNIIAQQKFNNKISYLDDRFNNMVMFKYNDLSFINDSYIWHFTGPNMGGWGNKANIMKDTWDIVKDKYK